MSIPSIPDHIEIRGARVHNLKGINVDVPLNKFVGIAGVSHCHGTRLNDRARSAQLCGKFLYSSGIRK